MATKRKKKQAPAEPTPLQTYFTALRSRPPDPTYGTFTARLGPARTADFNEAITEGLRGRLTLMASRIRSHTERLADTPERRLVRDVADVTARLNLRDVEARLDRMSLEAEIAPMRRGRAKDTGNALTRLIRAYRGRHRQATQGDVLAYLIALARRRNHPVIQEVTKRDDDYRIDWVSPDGKEHVKWWSDIRYRWEDRCRPARSQSTRKRKAPKIEIPCIDAVREARSSVCAIWHTRLRRSYHHEQRMSNHRTSDGAGPRLLPASPDIRCKLRDLSLRDVRDGTGVPLEVLRAYRRGDATPGPADFVKIWEYLSSDPPKRKRP